MTEGFTDIHQHIVYGMDDGAKSLEESLAMLKAAIRENTSTIIATPHITPGVYAFDLQKFGAVSYTHLHGPPPQGRGIQAFHRGIIAVGVGMQDDAVHAPFTSFRTYVCICILDQGGANVTR